MIKDRGVELDPKVINVTKVKRVTEVREGLLFERIQKAEKVIEVREAFLVNLGLMVRKEIKETLDQKVIKVTLGQK